MIYLPLEHIASRYTVHLDRDIRDYFKRHGVKATIYEPETICEGIREGHGSFLDADATVYRQLVQFARLVKDLAEGKVAPDETIWASDIWDFALLAVPYLNFFSGYRLKVRGFLHAGSFTDTDFVRQMERTYKGFEDSLLDFCDRIYVGSQFMKDDLLRKRFIPSDRLVVTGLPLDYEGFGKYRKDGPREPIVVFNGRNVDEKQPWLFDELAKRIDGAKFVNTQKEGLSKDAYYDLLGRATVVVSFALQENFGFGIQEAVALGCVPVVPDRLAYAEQFAHEYKYRSFPECVGMVKAALHGKLVPPSRENTNEKILDAWFGDFAETETTKGDIQ